QAEDGIRDFHVTGVQTCALPISLVEGLRTVLRVDESSYDPTRIWPGQHAAGMGADHPVAWYHAYDGGRVFVTALGHPPAAYDDAHYLAHLYGGLWWAATGRGLAHEAGEPPPAR